LKDHARTLRGNWDETAGKSQEVHVTNRILAAGIVLLMSCSLCRASQADSLLLKVAASATEDPAGPDAAQDLTAGLTITRSGFRIDRKTGFYVQTIQFTNSQTVPVTGPLYLVVADLSSGVTVVNAGLTENVSPAGSPYIALHPADGSSLQPGESLSLTLQFENGGRAPINYTPKVFKTLTTP
jgi:hypothetical protein